MCVCVKQQNKIMVIVDHSKARDCGERENNNKKKTAIVFNESRYFIEHVYTHIRYL